jgi:hypothetical protein
VNTGAKNAIYLLVIYVFTLKQFNSKYIQCWVHEKHVSKLHPYLLLVKLPWYGGRVDSKITFPRFSPDGGICYFLNAYVNFEQICKLCSCINQLYVKNFHVELIPRTTGNYNNM